MKDSLRILLGYLIHLSLFLNSSTHAMDQTEASFIDPLICHLKGFFQEVCDRGYDADVSDDIKDLINLTQACQALFRARQEIVDTSMLTRQYPREAPKYFCVRSSTKGPTLLARRINVQSQGDYRYILEDNSIIEFPIWFSGAYLFRIFSFNGEFKIVGPGSKIEYNGEMKQVNALLERNGGVFFDSETSSSAMFHFPSPLMIFYKDEILYKEEGDIYRIHIETSLTKSILFAQYIKPSQEGRILYLREKEGSDFLIIIAELDQDDCFLNSDTSEVECLASQAEGTRAFFTNKANMMVFQLGSQTTCKKYFPLKKMPTNEFSLLHIGDLTYDIKTQSLRAVERIYGNAIKVHRKIKYMPVILAEGKLWINPDSTFFLAAQSSYFEELCPGIPKEAKACINNIDSSTPWLIFRYDGEFPQIPMTLHFGNEDRSLPGRLVGFKLKNLEKENFDAFVVEHKGTCHWFDDKKQFKTQCLIAQNLLRECSPKDIICHPLFSNYHKFKAPKNCGTYQPSPECLHDLSITELLSHGFKCIELEKGKQHCLMKKGTKISWNNKLILVDGLFFLTCAKDKKSYKFQQLLRYYHNDIPGVLAVNFVRLPQDYSLQGFRIQNLKDELGLAQFPPFSIVYNGPGCMKQGDQVREGGPLGPTLQYYGEITKADSDKAVAFIFRDEKNEYLIYNNKDYLGGHSISRIYFPLSVLLKNPSLVKCIDHIYRKEYGFSQHVDGDEKLVNSRGKFFGEVYRAIIDDNGAGTVLDSHDRIVEKYSTDELSRDS